MADKLTLKVGSESAAYDFDPEAPTLEAFREFAYNRRIAGPESTDAEVLNEALLWFVEHVFSTARIQVVEKAEQEAHAKAKGKFKFDKPGKAPTVPGDNPKGEPTKPATRSMSGKVKKNDSAQKSTTG